jgi:hypothetical protein
MLVLVILEGVVLALLAVLVVGLLRSHAEILRRLHDLGAGAYAEDDVDLTAARMRTQPGVAEPRTTATPAHDISGTTPEGSSVAVSVVDRPNTTLLAFLSSGCLTCGNFWSAFADGQGEQLPGLDTRLVIITKGPESESLSAVQNLARGPAQTVMSSDAWRDYEVPVSPYFVLADGRTGGIIGEGSGTTWTQVRDLLEQACADAGLVATGGRGRRDRLDGPGRERQADDELRRAGITPGHPSLYGEPTGAERGGPTGAGGTS